MKNPDHKPLRIVPPPKELWSEKFCISYCNMLSNLAIAESNLVIAGKDSAMPHFIAIVKELELQFGFRFEIIDN